MYTKKQYSEPNVFSFSNFKVIIGIILSILVLIFSLLIVMVRTDFSLMGLTVIMPGDDGSLDLQSNSLVFMKDINLNSLPPRGELVTFKNESAEVLVRVINFEEYEGSTIFYVTGGGFIEHRIYSTDLIKQGSFLIPNLGKFVTFLITPAGLLVCLGFPLIAILCLLLMHFMQLPKKNGDYTFSQVENQKYFENATNTQPKNKRSRGKKANIGYNDPYEQGYNNQNGQAPSPWQTPNQMNGQNPNYPQQPQGYPQQNPDYSQNPNQNPAYPPQQNQPQSQPQNQSRQRPTIESILADVTGKTYSFDDEEYEDDYELDYAHEQLGETMPLNYSKPDVVDTDEESNSLIITREFFIAELQPENVTKAHEYTRGVGFQANLNDYEKNNFNIDGIDVNVDSNNIQLAITEDNDSDIFITVTEEFTNVVVNKENLETSFALFKDNEDDKNKVIIRKKQLG